MKEIICAWGRDVGVTMVSDIDYPMLSGLSWHISDNNASGKPYVRATVNRTTVYMHRVIVQCPPTYKVDHRNCNGLDNQRSNLRVTSHDQNNLNRSGWSKAGYKGVTLDGRRYRARITVEGVIRSLGRFSLADEAARAYDAAAHELFGEFAWLNFPGDYPPPHPDVPEAALPF